MRNSTVEWTASLEKEETMSRIPTPASIEASPAAAQPLLEAVKKQLGSVPNLFRIVGNSPAALEGYLSLNGALAKGRIDARTRERIATKLVRERGHVTAEDVRAVKDAGHDDAQIVEIVAHVALNTLTNYVNSALATEIDFPKVAHR